MLRTDEIRIRDPFVFVHDGKYILLGTTDAGLWEGAGEGFRAYVGSDLETWEDAGWLFRRRPDFWGECNFWAPEMHFYRGKYYLLASFKAPGRARATCALRSDAPLGPYEPFGEEQLTPRNWECLDGTLYVQGNVPYLVFCHEWLQVGDGEICAMPLKEDLSGPAGEPVLLFHASDAPWAVSISSGEGKEGIVTDGPFLWKGQDAKLRMLWSSIGQEGYALGISVSEGGIGGPWRQHAEPFFKKDGGHGMLFQALDGRQMLALHVPNESPKERPAFFAPLDLEA